MSHIKLHHNPKTNLKAKANPNPKLQKSEKKNFEKNFKKNFTANQELKPPPVEYNANTVLVHSATKAVKPDANFRSFSIQQIWW